MNDIAAITRTIRTKVNKLITAVHSLEIENKKLKEKQEELLQTIENKNKSIAELHDNNKIALIADSIKQTEGSSDVKEQIDEMVREIDKCIELLNK